MLGARLLAGVAASLLAAPVPWAAHAQTIQRATITVAATISAEAASQASLTIAVGPPAAVPARSFIRLRGLPPLAALSDGHSIAPGAWAVALTALPTLKIMLPAGTAGRADMVITLVSVDGAVLAEAKSALLVTAPRPVEPERTARESGPPPVASMLRAGVPLPTQPEATPAPRAPTPPAAKRALLPPDRERAERLMAKGEEQLADGNVSAARLFYERAAEAGLAQAAMALATTFDAGELAKLKVRGIEANTAEARRWYERARALGAAEAEQRLQRLGAQ